MQTKQKLDKEDDIRDYYFLPIKQELKYWCEINKLTKFYKMFYYMPDQQGVSLTRMINCLSNLGFFWMKVHGIELDKFSNTSYKCKFLEKECMFTHTSVNNVYTLGSWLIEKFMHKDEWLRLLLLRELRIDCMSSC